MQFTLQEYIQKQQKKQYARKLRKRMTRAEEVLWKELRHRRCGGHKFRRQVPIGPFVVDFLCRKQRLIIEVDGEIHTLQQKYDQFREAYLVDMHYRIVRFTNEEVLRNLPQVLHSILQHIQHPSPEPTEYSA